MDHDVGQGRRSGPDRRRRPTRPWDAFTTPARRRSPRREADRRPYAFVDRYDERLGILILMLLILTLTDGALTLVLIDLCCEEANPLMAVLIERGPTAFIAGKYAMTAVGLPVLLLFQDHRMFGTRFRVRHLFPAFVGLYLALLTYQVGLLRMASAADAVRPGPSAMAAAGAHR